MFGRVEDSKRKNLYMEGNLKIIWGAEFSRRQFSSSFLYAELSVQCSEMLHGIYSAFYSVGVRLAPKGVA